MADIESEYVLDAMVDQLDDYENAREGLEDADDEDLARLVYDGYDDYLNLTHGEYAVYATARDLLFERGYTFRSDDTLKIVDEESAEVL